MSENQQTNPTAIWQNLWCCLFKQAMDQFTDSNYPGCFKTLKMLKVQIPPECEKDVAETFEKAQVVYEAKTTGYNRSITQERKMWQIHNVFPPYLLDIMSAIRSSLYARGWINKTFNVLVNAGDFDKLEEKGSEE